MPVESLNIRLGIVEKFRSVPMAFTNCKNAVSPSYIMAVSKSENMLWACGNTSRSRVTVFPPMVM